MRVEQEQTQRRIKITAQPGEGLDLRAADVGGQARIVPGAARKGVQFMQRQP